MLLNFHMYIIRQYHQRTASLLRGSCQKAWRIESFHSGYLRESLIYFSRFVGASTNRLYSCPLVCRTMHVMAVLVDRLSRIARFSLHGNNVLRTSRLRSYFAFAHCSGIHSTLLLDSYDTQNPTWCEIRKCRQIDVLISHTIQTPTSFASVDLAY